MGDLNEPKKETVRISLPPRPAPTSDKASDARDTVRLDLPAQPPGNGNGGTLKVTRPPPPPPTARPPIPQPSAAKAVRPPSLVPKPRVPSAIGSALSNIPNAEAAAAPPPAMPPRPKVLPPPPRVIPPTAAPLPGATAGVRPAIYPGAASQGPKKETARINILPEPAVASAPTVKMSKTQPLLAAPSTKMRSAPVTLATTPAAEQAESVAAMFDAVPLPVCWILFGLSALTLLIQIWNYLAA